MLRNMLPVLSLWLLSPLIAEYLLGSLPMTLIFILPLMAAMYGSGALLVRETARRCGGGWVSIALLGLAYGLIEEGLVTQSLFNPNYLHLRLLDFGWIPALGIGVPWTIFVLTIHTVWSIAVPIGLTEALFPARRAEPWLGRIGIVGFALLFLAGSATVANFTYKSLPFMASPAQFTGTIALVVLLVAGALIWPRYRKPEGERAAPPALGLFGLAFAAGSGVMLAEHFGASLAHWPWPVSAAVLLGIEAAFVAAMAALTRGRRWTGLQRWAVMASGLLVYVVFGFLTDRELHGAADLAPHSLVALLAVLIAVVAWRRSAASDAAPI